MCSSSSLSLSYCVDVKVIITLLCGAPPIVIVWTLSPNSEYDLILSLGQKHSTMSLFLPLYLKHQLNDVNHSSLSWNLNSLGSSGIKSDTLCFFFSQYLMIFSFKLDHVVQIQLWFRLWPGNLSSEQCITPNEIWNLWNPGVNFSAKLKKRQALAGKWLIGVQIEVQCSSLHYNHRMLPVFCNRMWGE